MSEKHGPRRANISGPNGIRNAIRELAFHRDACNFNAFLSEGPYAGVGVLEGDGKHHDNDAEHEPFTGSFSKGLPHDANGFVHEQDYKKFKTALDGIAKTASASNDTLSLPASFKQIEQLFAKVPPRRLVNPLAGVASDPVGLDPMDITIPPAPRLNDSVAAGEMVELYWMALLRDVPFDEWEHHDLATQAIDELDLLNNKYADKPFAEHFDDSDSASPWSRQITLNRLFRGSAPGNDQGGYLSKFLELDVPFGTYTFKQEQYPLRSKHDYLTDWAEWLAVQNGKANPRFPHLAEPGRDELENRGAAKQPLRTLRDLAHYVHFDALHEAYFNAALILEGLGAPASDASAYRKESRQRGFGTFGGPHVLVLLTEVATRALKTVWHQKWYVHRRLRPETFGGRVHLAKTNADYSALVHEDLLGSTVLERIKEKTKGTYLLPMAFPEGSPMHPSYGAGHATVAGACVTILKAFYNTDVTLPGLAGLTVGGELNKLAANISIGRNAAGVHYRSDYTKSLALGEAVALATLQEHARCFVEAVDDGPVFRLEGFGGQRLEIDKYGQLAPKQQAPSVVQIAPEQPAAA